MPASVWTIVVAGGSGHRFGGPKQFEDLGGRPVVDWAVAAARAASEGVVLVVPPDVLARHPQGLLCGLAPRTGGAEHGGASVVVPGGSTRAESVRCGLAAVPEEAAVICVHDAARPFASGALFEAVVAAVVGGADGAVPGLPVSDTVKVIGDGGVVVSTPERATLVVVQTPQAFRAPALRRAHAGAGEATDDAALVEAAGGRVMVVPGEPANRKLTVPEDLDWARAEAARRSGAPR